MCPLFGDPLDLALLPPEDRRIDVFIGPLDLSYGHLEGARLIYRCGFQNRRSRRQAPGAIAFEVRSVDHSPARQEPGPGDHIDRKAL